MLDYSFQDVCTMVNTTVGAYLDVKSGCDIAEKVYKDFELNTVVDPILHRIKNDQGIKLVATTLAIAKFMPWALFFVSQTSAKVSSYILALGYFGYDAYKTNAGLVTPKDSPRPFFCVQQ